MTRVEATEWIERRERSVFALEDGRYVLLAGLPPAKREAHMVRMVRALERGEQPRRHDNGWVIL